MSIYGNDTSIYEDINSVVEKSRVDDTEPVAWSDFGSGLGRALRVLYNLNIVADHREYVDAGSEYRSQVTEDQFRNACNSLYEDLTYLNVHRAASWFLDMKF